METNKKIDPRITKAFLVFFASFSILMFAMLVASVCLGYVDLKVFGFYIALLLWCTFPFFQLVWFTDKFINNMSYVKRIIGFGLCFLVPMLFSAYFGGMPFQPETLGMFFGIYLAILVILSIAFSIYFKVKAGGYQQALDAYRRTRQSEK